ncbi:MAG: HAD-IA family hydrolase [Candidatus Omnitrophica bacterium]|nr:HAD-IA family hydrolase [Candidatus Omnitrophota bacterium]
MFEVDTIFFDVDGTLVDSSRDIANAMNYALVSLGFRKLSREEIVSHVGNGVKDLVRNCMGPAADEATVQKGSDLYWEYFMSHAVDETTLYPNAKEILDYFKDKRKIILTNRYKDFARATLTGLGIMHYFDYIIGGDDESCLKPNACIIDTVDPVLKIDRKRSLIVGDMDVDIMTGKNAGIKTCWVTHGLGKMEDIRHLGPDFIIEDLIELKKIIK